MATADTVPYWLTRFCFQRLLGVIYLIAFLVTLHQFKALIGEQGLVPVRLFLGRTKFWDAPSLFWMGHSDRFMTVIAWAGVILSLAAVTGLSDSFGMFVSVTIWFLLWLIYLSFVNVGQVFYSFGWEILLLEAGFLTIFLGSSDTSPPQAIVWLLRWLLFRVMFGAGLIKLRGDSCWRDLTCMFYHYETQPLPNPLSWYFHRLPPLVHKASVLFTHFVELVVPWGFYGPRFISYSAGILTILFHFTLILSGNLSWLNYLTLTLCIPCFDDAFLSRFIPLSPLEIAPFSIVRQGVVMAVTILVCVLSIRPIMNMISPYQIMNTSFDALHLVNTYGAFGSITRERMEIILEGTNDESLTTDTQWKEYEFKAKPGRVGRMPPIVAPYHYRLDWLMWFAAMSDYRFYPWILNLAAKLLRGDQQALGLLKANPFLESPPRHIRAELYHYQFTTPMEKKKTGQWWKRTRASQYLPPLSLDNPHFQGILTEQGW